MTEPGSPTQPTPIPRTALERYLVDTRTPVLGEPGTPDTQTRIPDDAAAELSEALADTTRRLGRYVRLRRIGSGGMGEVHLAWDPDLSRPVALKVIRGGEALASPELRERFLREARLAARLRHPGIVAVYEVGEADGLPFLAMEFVPGRTLADGLADETTRDPRACATLLRDVSEAVAHAHAHGVVHRDLKPGNILLDADGRPRVTDFGLAKEMGTRGGTMTGDVLGTPGYMSPEQASGRPVGPACDVFALGVILYEALTGQPPFDGPTVATILDRIWHLDPPSPSTVRGGVPRDLEVILAKALEKDPRRRYRTARELADDLGRFLAGEAILARPATLGYRLRRLTARHKAVTAAIVVTALGLLTAAVWTQARAAAQRMTARELYDMGRAAEKDSLPTALQHYAQAHRLWPGFTEAEAALQRVRAEIQRREDRAEREARIHTLALRVEEIVTDAWDLRTRRGEEALSRALARADDLCRQMDDLLPGSPLTCYARGRILLVRERTGEAVEQLRSAAKGDPGFTSAWLWLGIALYDLFSGDVRMARSLATRGCLVHDEAEENTLAQEAAEAFRRVIEGRDAASGDVARLYAEAGIAELEGRMTDAARAYERLADEPGWLGDRALVASAELQLETDPAAAARKLEVVHQWRPWHDRVTRALGMAYEWAGRMDELAALVAERARDGADEQLVHHLCAQLCMLRGDREGAEKAYTKILDLNPGSIEARVGRAVARHERGDLVGAKADYDTVLADRFDSTSLWNRANLLASLGDVKGAERDWTSLVACKPGHAPYWHARACLRLDSDLPGGKEDLEHALSLDPHYAEAWVTRGKVSLAEGAWEDALGSFRRATAADATLVEARLGEAEALVGAGSGSEALAIFNAVLKEAPKSLQARAARGNLLADLGDLTGAIEDYDAALAIDPKWADGRFNRALVREQMGELDAAEEDYLEAFRLGFSEDYQFRRACRLLNRRERHERLREVADAGLARFPRDPELLYQRGWARHRLGDEDGARLDWEKSLEAGPDHPISRRVRDLLGPK